MLLRTVCRAAGEVLALHPLVLHEPPPPASTLLEHRPARRPETRSARFGTACVTEIPVRELFPVNQRCQRSQFTRSVAQLQCEVA